MRRSLPLLYFNPHHRTGGDTSEVEANNDQNISIHTTARVVTLKQTCDNFTDYISIHTTARVVTGRLLPDYTVHADLNPHHRRGGDPQHFQLCVGEFISIHTTARVVTSFRKLIINTPKNFNPHHRTGGDQYWLKQTNRKPKFQSTPPHGW